MHERTIDGLTVDNVRYNLYAFGQDVKRFTQKRDRARTLHWRQHWEAKREEAALYLQRNRARLRAFEETPR